MVADQNRSEIEELFGLTVDLQQSDASGRSPLHIAVDAGDEFIVSVLLERGASANSVDQSGRSPMHLAAENQSQAIIGLLAENGADLFLPDNNAVAPLEILLDASVPSLIAAITAETLHQNDEQGNYIVHYAAEWGALSAIEHLLNLGADISQRNHNQEAPLDIALQNYSSLLHARFAKKLLENSAPRPVDNDFDYFFRTILAQVISNRNSGGNTALHIASQRNHSGIAELLLIEGAGVNTRNDDGESALHLAVQNNQRGIAELLLSSGADASLTDVHGNTVLFHAIFSQQPQVMLQFLIGQSINPNLRNQHGNTALLLGVQEELDAGLVNFLLTAGADPDIRNTAGQTALLVAVERELHEHSAELIRNGASIFAADNAGNTPIAEILRQGTEALSRVLTITGPNIQDSQGNNLLHHAAMANNAPSIDFLANNGADLNAGNLNGQRPLHLAMEQNSPSGALKLIELGADLYASDGTGRKAVTAVFVRDREWQLELYQPHVLELRDSGGNTIVFYSAVHETSDALELLLGTGVNVNVSNDLGESPLHWAVERGRANISSILITDNADVSAADNNGNTPLHLLGGEQAAQIGTMLLNAGAEIEARNNAGRTALHTSVRNQNVSTVLFLIEYGASLDAEDTRGRSPLFAAAAIGNLEIINILISAGITINSRDNEGQTAMHIALDEQQENAVELVRQSGGDIFAQNHQGETVIDMAIIRGSNLMRLLLNADNINYQDNRGNTPLHLAIIHKIDRDGLEFILSLNPRTDIRNAEGKRAIDVAREHQDEAALDLLSQN